MPLIQPQPLLSITTQPFILRRMDLPRPLLAQTDMEQVIFIVVFLLIAFINWVIKLLKERAETANRSRNAPTAEEIEARRRAWEGGPAPRA